MGALEGVVMELNDAAFPLLHGIEISDDPNVAFNNANQVFMVGSKPRGTGMLRSDLILQNGPIFTGKELLFKMLHLTCALLLLVTHATPMHLLR